MRSLRPGGGSGRGLRLIGAGARGRCRRLWRCARPCQQRFQQGAQRLRRIAFVERRFEVAVAGGRRDLGRILAGIGDRRVDRSDALRHLGQLQRQHAPALRCRRAAGRKADAAAQHQVQPRPRILGRRQLAQLALRPRHHGKCGVGLDHALADLLQRLGGVHLGGRLRRLGKQRMPHRLDAHPRLRIVLHRVPMFGQPKRCGRRDLRRRGRRARAVHVDDVGAVDLCPRHVRRVGAERRLHLARRPVVALHGAGSSSPA